MKLKSMIAALGLAALGGLYGAGAASATNYVYVGNWQVDQGPSYLSNSPNGPTAYTGTEAAALLFGGDSSDYVVSSVGPNAAQINFDAWYSVIGYGPVLTSDTYDSKYNGQYYGPTVGYDLGNPDSAASAYVNDTALGSKYTNYAFAVEAGPGPGPAAAPEPSSWLLMIVGVSGVGLALRRARRQVGYGMAA